MLHLWESKSAMMSATLFYICCVTCLFHLRNVSPERNLLIPLINHTKMDQALSDQYYDTHIDLTFVMILI